MIRTVTGASLEPHASRRGVLFGLMATAASAAFGGHALAGEVDAGGAAKTESGNQAVLIAPIAKALSAGVYTVRWQAVSVDTHHTQGTFKFTVKP